MKCSQCQIEINNNYCSKCGQKWTHKPTTLVGLLLETIQVLFSLERSVFATFLYVIYKPRKVVANYFNGFRRWYSSPGKVAFYAVSILALHVALVKDEVLGLSFTVNNNQQYTHMAFLLVFGILIFLVAGIYFKLKEKVEWSRTFIASIYIMCVLLLVFQLLQDIVNWCNLSFSSFQILYFGSTFIYLSMALTRKRTTKWVILNSLFPLLIFIALLLLLTLLVLHFSPDQSIEFGY